VFGRRAGAHAASFAKAHSAGPVNRSHVEEAARTALAPFERPAGEGPYQVQMELQERMQDLVGIVRNESDMVRALDVLASLRERTARVAVGGNREYNTGWHTALDLANLFTVSEAVTRAGLERKESRGAHFREDYPEKVESWGRLNLIVRKGHSGEMTVTRQPIPEMPPELKRIIEDNK
jgi:succinate dehydrogenase / fumarate reductase flavoprotein subunit